MRKWFVAALALAVVLSLAAGCSKPAETPAPQPQANEPAPAPQPEAPKQVLIGYGAPELYGGQLTIQNGLVESARALGFGAITTNANGDAQKQADQIDYFLSLGVKAVVVVPVDSAAICPSVNKVRSAGALFYTIDRAPTGCEADMIVLADNYLAGKQAGEAMVQLLTQKYGSPKGTVLELQGDLGTNVAVLRGGGFNDVMKNYPDIKIIQKPTNWQADKFSSIARDVVSTQEVDGIYLHSDNIGIPAVVPVLEQLGKLKKRGEDGHIFITGVDGGPAILQAIRDGWADGAASQPLPDFGLLAAQFIQDTLNGKPVSEGTVEKAGAPWSPAAVKKGDAGWQLFLSTTLVTEQNVDDPSLWGNQSK